MSNLAFRSQHLQELSKWEMTSYMPYLSRLFYFEGRPKNRGGMNKMVPKCMGKIEGFPGFFFFAWCMIVWIQVLITGSSVPSSSVRKCAEKVTMKKT